MRCSHFCKADACFLQDLSWSCPQSTRLSMCPRSSSQVITPGVGSGGTNPAHWEQFGYAPTSLHISSHMPASLLCIFARYLRSVAWHDFSSFFAPSRNTEADVGAFFFICSADACFAQAFSWSCPQSTRLSMCSRSSSQVITPGVGSGGTNPAHCAQFG